MDYSILLILILLIGIVIYFIKKLEEYKRMLMNQMYSNEVLTYKILYDKELNNKLEITRLLKRYGRSDLIKPILTKPIKEK